MLWTVCLERDHKETFQQFAFQSPAVWVSHGICTSTELWCADTARVSLSGLSRAKRTRTNRWPPIKIEIKLKLKLQTDLVVDFMAPRQLILVDVEAIARAVGVAVVAGAVHAGKVLDAVVGAVALVVRVLVVGDTWLGLVIVEVGRVGLMLGVCELDGEDVE